MTATTLDIINKISAHETAAERIEIAVTNPWSGSTYTIDVTGLTEAELGAWAALMDDDIRERVHVELAPCTPGEFAARYAELDPEGFDSIYHS